MITKQEKNFGKTWSFSYSSENQLTGIDITEGAQVTNIDFTYDALGRRTSKTVLQNGVTTVRKFVYDSQEIIAELDGNNQTLVKYTQSGLRTDDTLAMDVTSQGVSAGIAPAAGTYYFLKDGLGSIIDIANSTGTVVQHYVYSSFGKLLKIENAGVDNTANPNIKTPYSYTNREYDQESGLYYYRARYYDAHVGRFLQEDPDAGNIFSPITFSSRYSYVGNSPLNFNDPSGEFRISLRSIGRTLERAISNGIDESFNFQSNVLNGLGVKISPAQLARATLIIASVAGAVAGISQGNLHLASASLAVGYRNYKDFNNTDEKPSEIFWKSAKVGAAAAIGAEVGLFIGGVGGALSVPFAAAGAGKAFGLTGKEAGETGLAAGIGFLAGSLNSGGIGGSGGASSTGGNKYIPSSH